MSSGWKRIRTAIDGEEDEKAAFQGLCNVCEFLKKPCNDEGLLEAVGRVTAKVKAAETTV